MSRQLSIRTSTLALVSTLCLSLLFSPTARAADSGGEVPDSFRTQHAQTVLVNPAGQPSPWISVDTRAQIQSTYGIKTWALRVALRATADLIRGGASGFIKIGGRFLDSGAKSALKKHSGRIANVVDDAADLTKINGTLVRQYVYRELNKFLPSGTANVIANAVEGVMWILL